MANEAVVGEEEAIAPFCARLTALSDPTRSQSAAFHLFFVFVPLLSFPAFSPSANPSLFLSFLPLPRHRLPFRIPALHGGPAFFHAAPTHPRP